MKIIKNLSFLIIIVLIATMCNNHKKNASECFSYDASLDYDKVIYPFCVDSVDYKTVLNSISKSARIDTFIFITHDKQNDQILRISDSLSEMKLYRPEYKKSKTIYHLFEYSISSNLIKYKNEIFIGMRRKDFFKTMKIKYSECDSFELRDNDWPYHLFIFEKNKLKKIERNFPEL